MIKAYAGPRSTRTGAEAAGRRGGTVATGRAAVAQRRQAARQRARANRRG